MGLTYITASIINPGNPKRRTRLRFLVDSGAFYTVALGTILRRLGIRPRSSRVFTLADGTQITRQIGDAIFALEGEQAASPVIFGERGDTALFGTVSLEALGFMLDPMKRELRPLPMVLGRASPGFSDPDHPPHLALVVHGGRDRTLRRVPHITPPRHRVPTRCGGGASPSRDRAAMGPPGRACREGDGRERGATGGRRMKRGDSGCVGG